METGHFKLVIKPKRIIGTSKMDYEATAEQNSEVLLHYEQRQFSCVAETWNNEQIDDFVRKLGFLEAQSTDVEQKVKIFQQLNQVSS